MAVRAVQMRHQTTGGRHRAVLTLEVSASAECKVLAQPIAPLAGVQIPSARLATSFRKPGRIRRLQLKLQGQV